MNNVHSDYVKNTRVEPIPRGTLGWHTTGDFYVIYIGSRDGDALGPCWMTLSSGWTHSAHAPVKVLPPGTTVSITVG